MRQLEGAAFEEFAVRHSHATLPEMAQAWQQQAGVLWSTMSFSRALCRLGWTRKKELALPASMNRVRTNRLHGRNFKVAPEAALL